MRLLNQGTQTIIHHDCHPGNLFWHDKTPGLLGACPRTNT
jgi:Ser/Thr protein kinase RdoA (MazF antagonist)